MPESWDAGEYRNRATAWLQKAETLPAGRERDACLTLADGYTKLAELLEAQQGRFDRRRGSLAERSAHSSTRPACRNSGSVAPSNARITGPMRLRSISHRFLPGSHSPPAFSITPSKSCGQLTVIIAPSSLS
jgi:hypothetical protein